LSTINIEDALVALVSRGSSLHAPGPGNGERTLVNGRPVRPSAAGPAHRASERSVSRPSYVIAMYTMIRTATTPVASQAATTTSAGPQHYVFQTRTTESYHGGEYDGTLNLTVYPSGIASGWFRFNDAGDVRNVSGGVSGTQIWLDIGGTLHTVHIEGTLKNGVIDATENIPGPNVYTFHATVEPNSH
jgi:hypothetical protein